MDEILDTSVEGMVHNIKFLASHLHTIVYKFALQLRLLLEKTVAFHGIGLNLYGSLHYKGKSFTSYRCGNVSTCAY